MEITNDMLDKLREDIKPYLTDKRYLHTLAVEKETEVLARLFMPDEVIKLRVAALLHDITKKLSTEEQIVLAKELNIDLTEDEIAAPKLLHSKTASALISRDFKAFADERIISAVRLHTTGSVDMTMFDMIVYLADYIEETRTFMDCITLREYFYKNMEKANTDEEKNNVLLLTMVKSFNMTINCLIRENCIIDRNTVEARNHFLISCGERGISLE